MLQRRGDMRHSLLAIFQPLWRTPYPVFLPGKSLLRVMKKVTSKVELTGMDGQSCSYCCDELLDCRIVGVKSWCIPAGLLHNYSRLKWYKIAHTHVIIIIQYHMITSCLSLNYITLHTPLLHHKPVSTSSEEV